MFKHLYGSTDLLNISLNEFYQSVTLYKIQHLKPEGNLI